MSIESPKPNNTAIGERLREWLLEKFGKLKLAAAALKMSEQTLHPYLKGTRVPGNNVKAKLAELGADVDYIMTGRKQGGDTPSLETFEQHKDILIADLLRRVMTLERKFEENAIDLKKIKEEKEGTEITQTSLKNISNANKSGATPIQ